MELWDILDADGVSTGRTIARGQDLNPGDYHLVVHVWIRNERGDYLIQKRAAHLLLHPGIWATTGGSVVSGEDSLTGAVRETEEEMGLDLSGAPLHRVRRYISSDCIVDVWQVHVAEDLLGSASPGPEVDEVKWVSAAEIMQMVADRAFHAYTYLDWLLGLGRTHDEPVESAKTCIPGA